MTEKQINHARTASGGLAALCLALVSMTGTGVAQTQRTVLGQEYVPTIWVDPDGCEHWVMDDGAEGYLSQRLDKYGKPVCSGAAPPGVATGPFKQGSSVKDQI